MDLDWATLGVFLLSFLLCAVLVGVVSLMGAKEKTFEEALEEQKKKQQQQEQQKSKNKVSKKVDKKKKANVNDNKTSQPSASSLSDSFPESVTDKSDKEPTSSKRRRRGHNRKTPTPQPTHAQSPETETLTIPILQEKSSPSVTEDLYSENVVPTKQTNSSSILEIHRQYLQDDVADSVEASPKSITPEPLMKETLNLIKEAVPEELTPASTPEPIPEKPKGGKKKIIIEEVDSSPDVNKLHDVVEEHRKPSPMLGKGRKGKKSEQNDVGSSDSKPTKLGPKDLISQVKKTSFEDSECQQLIDILLNKQVGVGASNGDWVDTGNKGQHNEIKGLQKQLSELQVELEEEVARNKSITDRMNLLRQDYNQSKSQNISNQRMFEEVQGRHQHELSGLQGRLQQEVDQHQRDCNHLQSQLQFQITHATTLQVTIDQLQAQLHEAQTQAVDPSIFAEVENLRHEKCTLEAELTKARGQLSEGDTSIKEKLASLEKDNEQKLELLEKEKKKIANDLAKIQKDNKSLEERVKQVESSKKNEVSKLESDLSKANDHGKKVDEEVKRLRDENERLADQLASNVERPKVEGQEEESKVQNGLEETLQWKKKVEDLEEEKAEIVKDSDIKLNKLQNEIATYQTQIKQIQGDLDNQKKKNDELRNKNWKAMEALNSTEQSYQKLLKQDQSKKDMSDDVSKAKRDNEQSHQALLLRLFPEISPKKSPEAFEAWIEDFAQQIKAEKSASTSKESDISSELDKVRKEKEKEAEKLEQQISHYKMVLSQTENMLTELQSSVESEERDWKEKMAQKDAEIGRIKEEKEEVNQKNHALQNSLTVVKQAEEESVEDLSYSGPVSLGTKFAFSTMEQAFPKIVDEMQEKLRELQSKLSDEESEKGELFKKYSEAESQLKEVNSLKEEISHLKAKLSQEESKNSSLSDKLAKLSQVVSSSQEAIDQEQKTVELLRAEGKKTSDDSSSENGPKVEQEEPKTPNQSISSSSHMGSVGSLDSNGSANTPNKKVAKKKKATYAAQ